jgi:pimeloyl-ACP methyl ester carboxylesterase
MHLHFEEAGAGTPLVLIHGFPFDHTLWGAQLSGLAGSARVIAPDLRGFGNSLRATGVMTMEAHARDVKELLDHLGIEQAVIGGISMGGYVALALAELFPQAVMGLMLFNTRAVPDSEAAKRMREITALKALNGGMAEIAQDMAPKLISTPSAMNQPRLIPWVQALIARQSASGTAASSRGMAARPDRTPLLQMLEMKALVVTGSLDTTIAPAESVAMNAELRRSELVELPLAGHLTNVEAPEGFNAAVRRFLDRLL